MEESLTQALASGQPLYIESKVGSPGEERWLDSRLIPMVGEGGESRTVLGVSRDITERKQAEIQRLELAVERLARVLG